MVGEGVVSGHSEGTNLGVMGPGVYLTWHKETAEWFAAHSAGKHGGQPLVNTYRIVPNLKFIYRESSEYIEMVANLFYQRPDCNYHTGPPRPPYIDLSVATTEIPFGDPNFARFLAVRVKEAGYDGVVGRQPIEGLVVFSSKNVVGYTDPLACAECGERNQSCEYCKIPRCWECPGSCPCSFCKVCNSELEPCDWEEDHPRWCPKCQGHCKQENCEG